MLLFSLRRLRAFFFFLAQSCPDSNRLQKVVRKTDSTGNTHICEMTDKMEEEFYFA